MSDDTFRGWLRKYLKQHLGKWMREIDEEFMNKNKKEVKIKNWPTKLTIQLPCECCGEMVDVPLRIKLFRCLEDANWPYYLEYMSPCLSCSKCPKCRKPFRMIRPTAPLIQ